MEPLGHSRLRSPILPYLQIFFKTKDTSIQLFLVEYYKMKTDIIRLYLSPNSAALKLERKKKKNQTYTY